MVVALIWGLVRMIDEGFCEDGDYVLRNVVWKWYEEYEVENEFNWNEVLCVKGSDGINCFCICSY